MEIQGRAFFVTGGGSGLGAATVRRLAQDGANVLIADVNEEAGEELAADIGDGARFAHADVTDEKSTQGALDAAREAFGGLHGLVNCAGIGPAEKVVGKRGVHSLDSFVKAVQINLVGTFNPIRLAAPIMMENEPNEDGERGVIVNTASVAAFDGWDEAAVVGPPEDDPVVAPLSQPISAAKANSASARVARPITFTMTSFVRVVGERDQSRGAGRAAGEGVRRDCKVLAT